MATRDIVVAGASIGGVEAFSTLASLLRRDLPASVFIVQHVGAHGRSFLPEILTRAGPLTAIHPADRTPIERGRIYIAPPDRHLLVEKDCVRVIRGPRENGHRPAVDTLFRSAAHAYGNRVVGVVLSGSLYCGAAGLRAVKGRGGVTVVQSPAEARCPDMPRNALEHVEVDHTLTLSEIARLIDDLARAPVPESKKTEETARPASLDYEEAMEYLKRDALENDRRPGRPAGFSCPECGGALWELDEKELLRFRCRVGHGYVAETLELEQRDATERAMWAALRALEERRSMLARLAHGYRERGSVRLALRYEEHEREASENALAIRRVLVITDPRETTVAEPPPGSSPGIMNGEDVS